MAAKKKAKAKKKKAPAGKAKRSARKRKTVAKKSKKAPAKKAKKAKKAPAKSAAAKKAPAKKAAKKKPQTVGEGDYEASRAFLKDQSGFVARNKSKISEMGKQAERALDGPEGGALRDAEAEAAGRSRDIFGA